LGNDISGEGIVTQGTTCHNIKMKPTEVKIEVTDVHPIECVHPIYNYPIEKGSFIAVPAGKLHSLY